MVNNERYFLLSETNTSTTKTFFSVINKFTENTCIKNISDKDAAINNLSS